MAQQNDELKRRARQEARAVLVRSTQFSTLPPEEQFTAYQAAVKDSYDRQLGLQNGAPVRAMVGGGASELIDDARHRNQRIDQAGDLAGDFIQQVDFPQFVKDLLKGVFDANLAVTVAQMDKFLELMKAATGSISKFINAVDEAASFAYLAENDNENFSLGFDDEEKDENGRPKQVLMDKDGAIIAGKSDAEVDAAIKAKIMDAKIAMAREQRALLRETILMGVTRLVVERGRVQASVLFDFKADERIQKQDKASVAKERSSSHSIAASGGLFGSLVPGVTGGGTNSQRETKISVSSAKSEGTTSLAAKLTGSVDITFKSDYFKLDNFAAMYGGLAGAAGGAAQAGGTAAAGGAAPAALPAAPAALPAGAPAAAAAR
jgi:hypothetical protein